jgi:hypothetical protein
MEIFLQLLLKSFHLNMKNFLEKRTKNCAKTLKHQVSVLWTWLVYSQKSLCGRRNKRKVNQSNKYEHHNCSENKKERQQLKNENLKNCRDYTRARHALYPSTLCRRAIPKTALRPFQGWPNERAACSRLLPVWIHHAVCRTPMEVWVGPGLTNQYAYPVQCTLHHVHTMFSVE